MSNKKEKIEFVRSEQFEAVDDELGQALELLEQANARVDELLNSESRGELPYITATEPTGVVAVSEGTPRVRRGRQRAEQPAE